MRTMRKSEILGYTHARFFLRATGIDPIEVTKKALRNALKIGHFYTVDVTARATISYGKNAGKTCYNIVILL